MTKIQIGIIGIGTAKTTMLLTLCLLFKKSMTLPKKEETKNIGTTIVTTILTLFNRSVLPDGVFMRSLATLFRSQDDDAAQLTV